MRSSQQPGYVLLNQHLKPTSLSQNALAKAISVPPRRINEIILGKRAITADTALRLGTYFGNDASYWMNLQTEYDLAQIEKKISSQLNKIVARTHGTIENPAPEQKQPPEHRLRRRMMR